MLPDFHLYIFYDCLKHLVIALIQESCLLLFLYTMPCLLRNPKSTVHIHPRRPEYNKKVLDVKVKKKDCEKSGNCIIIVHWGIFSRLSC